MPRLTIPSLDSRPVSPKPSEQASLSLQLGPRSFDLLAGSRAYTQLEQGLDSIFRQATPEPPLSSRQRVHTQSRRALTKSHSRVSLFEDETVDDLEVYHTITGSSIAASRQPVPFAKILRRPAQLAARMDSVDGKREFEGLVRDGDGDVPSVGCIE